VPAFGSHARLLQRWKRAAIRYGRRLGEEIARHQPRPEAEGDGPLHAVAQFPHVARPAMRNQRFLRQRTEARQVGCGLSAKLVEEARREPADVVGPLPKRRDGD
jgi:hypothetical protein